MIASMSTHIDESTTIEFVPTPISLRSDQREWLDSEAIKEMRAKRLARQNRSSIVQEAIDLLRAVRERESTP